MCLKDVVPKLSSQTMQVNDLLERGVKEAKEGNNQVLAAHIQALQGESQNGNSVAPTSLQPVLRQRRQQRH